MKFKMQSHPKKGRGIMKKGHLILGVVLLIVLAGVLPAEVAGIGCGTDDPQYMDCSIFNEKECIDKCNACMDAMKDFYRCRDDSDCANSPTIGTTRRWCDAACSNFMGVLGKCTVSTPTPSGGTGDAVCDDGLCETDKGESCANCPSDCSCSSGEACQPSDSNADARGCVIVTVPKGMALTVSTDKKTYSPGETVIVSGSVRDAKSGGPISGANVVIDINSKVSTTTDSSGNYKKDVTLPSDISQGTHTVTVTASKTGYPDVSQERSFNVGEVGIQIEKNMVTNEPFRGLAADGVSSLTISISLLGYKGVKVTKPYIGELKGDAVRDSGKIELNSDGNAVIEYHPPDYLTKDQLTNRLENAREPFNIWVAKVPLTFTYINANNMEEKTDVEILVCRPPVMMVHGFLGSAGTWQKMSDYLRGDKFDTYSRYYYAGDQSIEAQSVLLKETIQGQKVTYAMLDIKLAKVDVVGHSMGGLIARQYVNPPNPKDYKSDVRKLIMVGTPNHGTDFKTKKGGNVLAWLRGKHELASDELYCESSFIKNLNRGEKIGEHLNYDVEYGNIYGFPDDWVVDSSSADLNGVLSKSFSGVKHSAGIPVLPYVGITEYLKVWEQVKEWLTQDIYKPQLRDFRMEVSQGFGEVYIVEYYTGTIDERKVGSYPTGIETWQRLKTGDGMATIKLMLDNQEWGTIYLNRHSEIRVGLFSPKLMEIKFMEGSARFKSRGGHFQVNIKDEGIIRGLDTDFVITAEDNIKVYCLEGRAVLNTFDFDNIENNLSSGESVAINGEEIININFPNEPWWETDTFDDEEPNNPPTASFSIMPENPTPDDTIVGVGASSSDPDGDTLTYSWYVDGVSRFGNSPKWEWENPQAGGHTIKLVVEDGKGGSDEDSTKIKVIGPTPTDTPGFEIAFLIGAIIVALIVIKRRKHNL